MKTLLNVAVFISFIFALVVLSTADMEQAKANDKAYAETHQLVTSVAHAMTGQFCKHGATLILLGKYEQAKQYNKDFGSCMRNLVKKVQLER